MGYIIREAVLEDAVAICELNSKEMGYEYPLSRTREKLSQLLHSDTDKIYVAVCENAVVGYVHANDYDLLYASHLKNIMGIAVFREYTKIGIGKALLSKVEEWAKETGAKGVRLVSGSTRTEAHEFYHRCGYSGDKQQLNLKKIFEDFK